MSRLALGAAQFGMPYGVTGPGFAVAAAELAAIVERAGGAGIDTIDVAAAYGGAEDALGRSNLGDRFKLVTKTMPTGLSRLELADVGRVASRFHESLVSLRAPSVDCLLVHASSDVTAPGGAALWRWLEDMKTEGLAARIGVSIYERSELDAVLERCTPDIVQLPMNALDQRLLADGTLDRLHAEGIAVHLRSVFLQGLLLIDPAGTPAHLPAARAPLERWSEACKAAGASQLSAALAFALRLPQVERIVVGVQGVAQLAAIIEAELAPPPAIDYAALAIKDESVIDPRRWPKLEIKG